MEIDVGMNVRLGARLALNEANALVVEMVTLGPIVQTLV